MAVVVLRAETLTAGGDIAGDNTTSLNGAIAMPPESEQRDVITHGSAFVTGLGSITWASSTIVTAHVGTTVTYQVGFAVTATGPDASTDADDDGDTWVVTSTPLIKSKAGTGSWSLSAECELCEEWLDPAPPSGTGSDATGYNPDPPHDRTRRVFWRTKDGGAWDVSCSVNAATAAVSGTWASAAELGWPLMVGSDAYAVAGAVESSADSGTAVTECSHRTAALSVGKSVSIGGGSADASGSTATATASTTGNDGSSASAEWTAAVPFAWSLDAQLRAWEAAYPDSIILRREGHGTTVDTSAVTTGAYSTSDTDRSESCHVEASDGTDTVEESNDIPSTFGPISLSIKSSSASTNQEPTTDLPILMHAREMAGLSISQPASVNVTAGTDSSLGGSPWGRTRSWAAVGPGWVGLMGWRYLSLPVTVASGTGSQSATVRIGSKSWTKDSSGATLTTGTSGGAAVTWTIDLCSPSSETGSTDATDTTYPYNDDWDVAGGDEDDYYRTGEGSYSGVMRAASLSVEVGASASLTLGTFSLTRTDTNDALLTSLPPHRAWVQERPDRVISEADTTTEYFVRQAITNQAEGRLLALEWTDTLWKRTTGGASGVVTHTVTRYGMDWLADRINAHALALGWTATENAPAVAGSGVAVWYNRDRELHDLLGGGYWFEPFSVTYPTGRWRSGIDFVATGKPGGTLTSYDAKHQCRFYRLLACPGDVGDIDLHLSTDTTGATPLKAAKVLRNQGEGLSLDTSGVSSSGDTLTLTQAATARGTGTTGTDGYAQTGSSYGRGDGGDVTLAIAAVSSTYPARARKRTHLRAKVVEESGGCLSASLSPTMRTARCYAAGGTLWMGFASLPGGYGWSDTDTGIASDCGAICYRPDGALLMDYIDGSAIKRALTYNEGGAFSVATVFATGANPALCVSPTGMEYHFCTAFGAIKMKAIDPQGTTVIAETTIIGSGVDDDSIAVVYRQGTIILLYAVSGVITVKRSDDYTTWT